MTKHTSRTGKQQSRNLQEYKRIRPDEFVQAAKALVELGWHPIPLGKAKGKELLVGGVTGYEGIDITDEDIFREWADRWAATEDGLNLATRMPVGVIALDVDCYGDKPGAETMASCVDEWGDLPPTWSITARSDGSSKLLYRVPEDWKGVGVLPAPDGKNGSGVEVIQRHHRYAVVPPSVHDVGPVRLFDPNGDQCDHLPTPDELPKLPEAWCDGLYRFRTAPERDSTADPQALLASYPGGAMSEAVQKAADKALAAIRTGAGRHDAQRDALLELMTLGRCGAPGVPLAVSLVRNEFLEMRRNEGQDGQGDFDRSMKGAAEIAATISPFIAGALQPGGAWHKDTRWVPSPDGDDLLVRGVGGSAGEDETGSECSWVPVDVAAALKSDGPPKPSVLRRADGECLFYAGKVHSVHGESESGKSWVAQCAAVQELIGQGRVLYVDFEDDVTGVAGRLVQLGVPVEVVGDPEKFVYVHPEESLTSDRARDAFEALVSKRFTLAVVDGVTDAMGIFGYSLTDNDDIAKWQRELPRRIASRSGAAVVCIDHVTKDADSRGRFSIGGQHKIAGLDGAAFTVEVDRPFGRGLHGFATLRVGKDRPGHLRGLGVGWRKQDRTQKVAVFDLDATGGALAWGLNPPVTSDEGSDAGLGAAGDASIGSGGFRPTWYMEQISRYWEQTESAAARTQNKTVTAMCEERKARGKNPNRQHWRTAIATLVDEGYASTAVGPRNAEVHSVIRPYRQTEDPKSDTYTGGRTFTYSIDEDGSARPKPRPVGESEPEAVVEQ